MPGEWISARRAGWSRNACSSAERFPSELGIHASGRFVVERSPSRESGRIDVSRFPTDFRCPILCLRPIFCLRLPQFRSG